MEGIVLGDLGWIAMTILWLVFIEGLLSADNALVLAMMVRHLPKVQQKRALRYGIWGAFGFRVIAVLLARVILNFWYLKVVGGGYLLYLAGAHFLGGGGHEADGSAPRRRFGSGFWGTVVSVELADIAFSIDSILAAVALADGMPSRIGPNTRYAVIITGGILGIITMRFVAGYFILLLDRFRGLEPAAYGLVAWIGVKLVLGGLHHGEVIPFELDERVFWGGMLAIVVLGFVMHPRGHSKAQDDEIRDVVETMQAEMAVASEEAAAAEPEGAPEAPVLTEAPSSKDD